MGLIGSDTCGSRMSMSAGGGQSATPATVTSVLRYGPNILRWNLSHALLSDVENESATLFVANSIAGDADSGNTGQAYIDVEYSGTPARGDAYSFPGATLGGLSVAAASGTVSGPAITGVAHVGDGSTHQVDVTFSEAVTQNSAGTIFFETGAYYVASIASYPSATVARCNVLDVDDNPAVTVAGWSFNYDGTASFTFTSGGYLPASSGVTT